MRYVKERTCVVCAVVMCCSWAEAERWPQICFTLAAKHPAHDDIIPQLSAHTLTVCDPDNATRGCQQLICCTEVCCSKWLIPALLSAGSSTRACFHLAQPWTCTGAADKNTAQGGQS